MTETPRMREIREEAQRLEATDPTDCEACRAAWAAQDARIKALVAEWEALDVEQPGGAERAVVRAAYRAAGDGDGSGSGDGDDGDHPPGHQ